LNWRSDLETRLRTGKMAPALEAHLAKYRKLVPALALINHLVDNGHNEISQRAMRKALAFSKYLETHARRLYGATDEPEGAAAQAILTKDAGRGTPGRFYGPGGAPATPSPSGGGLPLSGGRPDYR
jgi:putative DNA primase/helicase